LPTYRQIWEKIRTNLPRKGRGTDAISGEPVLSAELEGAINSLYDNYRKYHDIWAARDDARARGLPPPVFIVVCNNTNVSKLVFDYIAGWEKTLADGLVVLVPGKLDQRRSSDCARFGARCSVRHGGGWTGLCSLTGPSYILLWRMQP
jgi:type III restriction enzyme